jgi:hypothetical protein
MTQTSTDPDEVDPTSYGPLLRDARRTGRCPVLLGSDALVSAGVLEQPDDVIAAIDRTDPEQVLAGWWPGEACLPGCPCGERLPSELPPDPLGDAYPDLSRSPETIDDAVDLLGEPSPLSTLAVVGATRPADTPAVLGWAGFCNYHPYQDHVRLCAVLRRWEERYGALLVQIDRSRLHLSVARPPTTDAECRRVAAEHFAFCPDQQDPQNGDFYTLSRYAAMMRGTRSWHFWWD